MVLLPAFMAPTARPPAVTSMTLSSPPPLRGMGTRAHPPPTGLQSSGTNFSCLEVAVAPSIPPMRTAAPVAGSEAIARAAAQARLLGGS